MANFFQKLCHPRALFTNKKNSLKANSLVEDRPSTMSWR